MAVEAKNKPANIIAIAAFALLLLLAVWSGIQIVKFAPRVFSGFGFGTALQSEPKINLEVDKAEIKKDEEIKLTWRLEGKSDGGTVSFVYKCTDGVVLAVYDDLANTYKNLPCSSPFNIPLSKTSLKIKATEINKSVADLPLAIVYTNSEGKKYKDIKKISLKNDSVREPLANTNKAQEMPDSENQTQDAGKEGAIASSGANAQSSNNSASNTQNNSSTSASKRTAKNNKCESKIYGKPDLSIHHLRIGTIVNGYFVQKNTFYAGETIVVKFTVSNFGTKTSPAWYFQAQLPNKNGNVYTSKAQPAIAPCSGRYYTLRVQNPAKGSSRIRVIIDPNNLIKELNEINNSASGFVNVY